MAQPTTDKATLTSGEVIHYVGGRSFFAQLEAAYPTLVKPLRVGKSTGKRADGTPQKGKAHYLKEAIDAALRAAHTSGQFLPK